MIDSPPPSSELVDGEAPSEIAGSPRADSCVDVSVVAYRSGELLKETLGSVAHDPLVAKIVVVDHGTGSDALFAKRCGAHVLVDSSNPGFGRGQNRAAAEGSSQYLLVLNPDCKMSLGALSAGVWALQSDPTLGAVGGVIRSSTGLPERAGGIRPGAARLVLRSLGVRRLLAIRSVRAMACRTSLGDDHINRVHQTDRTVQFLTGAALLVRRTAFESVAGFDERFFLYGEDVDLCRRLEIEGWGLKYLPLEWAHHVGSASFSDTWRREAIAWEGAMRDGAKWWGDAAFATALVASALRWATLTLCRPSLGGFAARRMLLSPLRDRGKLRQTRRTATVALRETRARQLGVDS